MYSWESADTNFEEFPTLWINLEPRTARFKVNYTVSSDFILPKPLILSLITDAPESRDALPVCVSRHIMISGVYVH